MKDLDAVKTAMLAQNVRFGLIADPAANPFPVEATIDQVLSEIKTRLKAGIQLHPPVRSMAGDKFAGMQLLMIDAPPPPGVQAQPKTRLVVQIITDLDDMAAPADQNFLAYGVMALVFSSFMEDTKAEMAQKKAALEAKREEKKKGEHSEAGKVETLPGSAAAPVKQPDDNPT
jgi:hypothetical protein